jgi:hypothetical protein
MLISFIHLFTVFTSSFYDESQRNHREHWTFSLSPHYYFFNTLMLAVQRFRMYLKKKKRHDINF